MKLYHGTNFNSIYKLPLLDAFDKVYGSRIYTKLVNTTTGLYLQSPDYIYDYLKEELAGQ